MIAALWNPKRQLKGFLSLLSWILHVASDTFEQPVGDFVVQCARVRVVVAAARARVATNLLGPT